MQMRHIVRTVAAAGFFSLALVAQPAPPVVVIHEPWLNWDFFYSNPTGQPANDFEIIVDAANWSPSQTTAFPFLPTPTVTHGAFGDPDGAATMLTWSGAQIQPVPPDNLAHIGAYMAGSGEILDAYWTFNGVKVGESLPITYELTRVVYDDPLNPWLGMRLSWPDSFFDVFLQQNPDGLVGWTKIRTFSEIDADLLDLPDLNAGLDLNNDPRLAGRETEPRVGGPGGPVIDPSQVYWYGLDSFFDVFVDGTFTASPNFEALLYATVVVDRDGNGDQMPVERVGQFWNLNRQSPEPSTALLLALGGLGCLLRRRRQVTF